jgi:hypothetical protein
MLVPYLNNPAALKEATTVLMVLLIAGHTSSNVPSTSVAAS